MRDGVREGGRERGWECVRVHEGGRVGVHEGGRVGVHEGERVGGKGNEGRRQ